MIDFLARSRRMLSAAFLCAALVLFVVSAFAIRAHAQTAARLDGQIANGTAGIAPDRIAELNVTLYQMGASGPITHTAQTDTQGRFAFNDLQLDAQGPLFAQVDYEGIHYFSEVVTADVVASHPLTVTVYETQTLPADYQIDRVHFILDVGQKSLSGAEFVQVKNATDRAFLLPLPLPQDASDVEFNDPRDQFRAVRNPNGSILFPILPTTDQVLLGVQMTTKPPEYVMNINVPVNVGGLNVLVSQATGAQISSTQLTPGQPFSPQSGTTYSQLSGAHIPANSTVAVSITNLPGADNSTMVRAIVLGAGGLAALALLSLALFRPHAAPPFPPSPTGDNTSADERLARLKSIAALDDAFEAGQIPEDEYLAQRAALKAELLLEGPDPTHSSRTSEDRPPEPERKAQSPVEGKGD